MLLKDVKRLLGTKTRGPEVEASKAKLGKWDLSPLPADEIPDSFDVREAWPQCAGVTSTIADQSACGSCWAVSSTDTFRDRYCIAKNTTSLYLSSAATLSCCNLFSGCIGSSGCDGGQPSDAWGVYFQSGNGVPTGSFYGAPSGEYCYNYPFAQCAHHVHSDKYPDCPANEYSTPQCPTQSGQGCQDPKYPVPWAKDVHFASSSYGVQTVQGIQTEIMARGSVTAAFDVYADFPLYKSGVYVAQSSDYLGGHAVRVIGWGVENNTPYWLVANSWNPTWGDNGTFKILRGQDECGIEDSIVAGSI